MEIGGYMELEHFHARAYYHDLKAFNLARTSLLWLLKALECKKLYLPYMLCDSVIEACTQAGYEVIFYHLDEALNPLVDGAMQEGEYLYLVSYYGQLTDEKICEFRSRYGHIIVDHTQAFFQRPLKGVPTIYSCRKYFGVSDGAYLSVETDYPLPEETDASHDRMLHLLGRFECTASEYYQTMLTNADAFHQDEPKQMSPLTHNLMRAIDYDYAAKAREENYRYLKEHLPCDHVLNRHVPEGPFAYPYHVKDAARIRKALAAKKIYVPTNWSNVVRDMPEDSVEYDLAANVLSLPCDQRYTVKEMEQIVRAVREALA